MIDTKKLKDLYIAEQEKRKNAENSKTDRNRRARQFANEINWALGDIGITDATVVASENEVHTYFHQGGKPVYVFPCIKVVGRENGLWYLHIDSDLACTVGIPNVTALAESFIAAIIKMVTRL